MNINWRVRIKNKTFWLSIIPALIILVQTVLAPFGYNWDFGVIGQQITAIINAVFAVLAILGVVSDPTTPGMQDSERAMQYSTPGKF